MPRHRAAVTTATSSSPFAVGLTELWGVRKASRIAQTLVAAS